MKHPEDVDCRCITSEGADTGRLLHTGRTARVAKLTLKPMNITEDNQNKLHQGYTILPDGTRHEFVIEGWEEYNRTVDRSYDGNPDREVTDHGKHNCLL